MNPHWVCDHPSDWVVRFAPLVPSGEVLDLACGNGRHARHFARLGHRVLAVDRDTVALAGVAGDAIIPMQIDLESDDMRWPFKSDRFAGIVVTNYLHRPLLPHILASLAPGGILIYETFGQGNQRFGKPSNPDFLLAPGELLDMVRSPPARSLRVIAYEDGFVNQPKPAMVQRICALKLRAGEAMAENLRLF